MESPQTVALGDQPTANVASGQTAVPSKSGRSPILYIIIGILVLAILGVGGYVVYDRYFGEEEENVSTQSAGNENSEENVTAESTEEKESLVDSETEYDQEGTVACTNVDGEFSIEYPDGVDFDDECNYRLLAFSDVEDIDVVDDITDFRKNWLFGVSRTETVLTAQQYAENEIQESACPGCEAEEGVLQGSYQFTNTVSNYSRIATYYKAGDYIYIFDLNARNPDVYPSDGLENVYLSIVGSFEILD